MGAVLDGGILVRVTISVMKTKLGMKGFIRLTYHSPSREAKARTQPG